MTAAALEERLVPVVCVVVLIAVLAPIVSVSLRNPPGRHVPPPAPRDSFPHPLAARGRTATRAPKFAGRRGSRRPRGSQPSRVTGNRTEPRRLPPSHGRRR